MRLTHRKGCLVMSQKSGVHTKRRPLVPDKSYNCGRYLVNYPLVGEDLSKLDQHQGTGCGSHCGTAVPHKGI